MYIGDFPPNDYFAPNKGWVCPKCGRVYSPSTPMCWYCGDKQITNAPNTTGTPVNWDEYLRKTVTSINDTPPVTYSVTTNSEDNTEVFTHFMNTNIHFIN